MTDLKYSECRCTVPPDASRCPNCGNRYDAPPAKAQANSNGNRITIICIGYVAKCPEHRKIYIRASVASEPTRCPFC